jgi:DNA polymerase-3 subunit alpha
LAHNPRQSLRQITFIGMVSGIKTINDRNGRPMAFVTLEDFQGTVEGVTFADLFEKKRRRLISTGKR